MQIIRDEPPTEIQEELIALAQTLLDISDKPMTWATHVKPPGNTARGIGEKIAKVSQ